MQTHIDPLVDCVFKAILGSEDNKNLLLHFLNAVLDPPADNPIKNVIILNPFDERKFLDDKLTIVDVKATFSDGSICQIEVQRSRESFLDRRMRFTWCKTTAGQLKKGQDFKTLRPTISIWVMGQTSSPASTAPYHRAYLHDPKTGYSIDEASAIHILELPNLPDSLKIFDDRARWMYFFKEGSKLDRQTLPAQMDTPEMRQALETAMSFSEETRRRFLYQDRFIAELVENTRKNESRQSKEDLQRAKEALENAYGELKDMQFQLQKAEFAKDAAINQRALDKEARAQAEAAKQQAEADKQQAEADKQQAEADKQQAEDEIRALKAQLAALKGSSD